MSKLYVPDGAWLVCSKGMKKQQIAVTSHNKVFIAGNHLKATIEDRPGGNFVCGRMAIAGGIIGAVVGVVLVAGSVLTGGALADAACAAAGTAAGLGVSLTPSICGMLLHKWQPYDTNVLTANIPPLLENSQIPCRLGGTVIILYSEKAADEFTNITIGSTLIDVVGVIALSYLIYPALSALGNTAVSAKAITIEFGLGAGANYLGGFAISAGTAYGIGWGIDKGKNIAYGNIPTSDGNTVKDYIGGFESDPLKVVENTDISKSPDTGKEVYEHVNDAGGAADVGQKNVGNRTSQVVTNEKSSSVRLDDIEENGPTITNQSGKIDGAIVGKTQTKTSHIEVTNQDYGGRYQEVDRHSITVNSQYDPNSFDMKTVNNSINRSFYSSLDDNFSRPNIDSKNGISKGGFYLGLLQDAYKGITNFILKGQAEDLQKALLDEEVIARAKINVLAGKD